MAELLTISGLSVAYRTGHGTVPAIRGVTLGLHKGEVLGLVGESGSGKSTLAGAMMALLPANADVSGQIVFNGVDLFGLNEAGRRRLRGNGIAAINQDPFTALNPTTRIGRQLAEFQRARPGSTLAERRDRAERMLARVGISEPKRRMRQYPFELSGGIRQRVMIAAALLTEPLLLIADEPTTALDATTEVQIVELLRASRSLVEGAIVLVTHDIALVAALCDRVAVLYAGEVVEAGDTASLVAAPRHPYTKALLKCDPAHLEPGARKFPTIAGQVPEPAAARKGCVFAPRCCEAMPLCVEQAPPMVPSGADSFARCHSLTA